MTEGSGTVRSRSRTRLSSSASVIRFAVCWLRMDPPSTRERPINAWLPQAKQWDLVLVLINSHCTQNVADCKGTKGTSFKVVPYTVLRNMIAESSFPDGANDVTHSTKREKVTWVVPGVEKGIKTLDLLNTQ